MEPLYGVEGAPDALECKPARRGSASIAAVAPQAGNDAGGEPVLMSIPSECSVPGGNYGRHNYLILEPRILVTDSKVTQPPDSHRCHHGGHQRPSSAIWTNSLPSQPTLRQTANPAPAPIILATHHLETSCDDLPRHTLSQSNAKPRKQNPHIPDLPSTEATVCSRSRRCLGSQPTPAPPRRTSSSECRPRDRSVAPPWPSSDAQMDPPSLSTGLQLHSLANKQSLFVHVPCSQRAGIPVLHCRIRWFLVPITLRTWSSICGLDRHAPFPVGIASHVTRE